MVLRIDLELAEADRGGRRRPIVDGYRASMSFGRRRRGVEPIVHDAVLVLEGVDALAPGERGVARAWVILPDELPRHVSPGTVFALLEHDRIIARAELLEALEDPTPHPLRDLAAAKTRTLVHTNDATMEDVSNDAPPAPGPYLQTVSGRWVNPFDPDPQQLDAGDIARALANQCRFGGHCRVFYSVAQHSVIVSELVEQRGGDADDVFAALMHDATEAYLGDMPHPLKHRSPLGAAFKEAEQHLEKALADHFRIKADVPEIKRADRALLATERRAFSAESWHWPELEGVEPLDLELTAWTPDEAARVFAARYAELDARRG